jgi:protein-arginine kinase activator protein McsA
MAPVEPFEARRPGGGTCFNTSKDLESEMREAATNLEFEKAARLRDEVKRLREMELDTLEGEVS